MKSAQAHIFIFHMFYIKSLVTAEHENDENKSIQCDRQTKRIVNESTYSNQ